MEDLGKKNLPKVDNHLSRPKLRGKNIKRSFERLGNSEAGRMLRKTRGVERLKRSR